MAKKKSPSVGTKVKKVKVLTDPNRDKLEMVRNWMVSHFDTTDQFRLDFKKCQDFANGDQWRQDDLEYRQARNLPAVTVNNVATLVDIVSGMQRTNRVNITPVPRERMDAKVSEVARACLLAARDFSQYDLVWSRVFDDATIGGLGFMEVLYTLEDADDPFWGDIVSSRINPLSMIWDPWNMSPDRFQKSAFVGKKDWVNKTEWESLFPGIPFSPNDSGERGLTSDLDVPEALRSQFFDERTGKTALITMWHKEAKKIKVVANEETGQVVEIKDKESAERVKAQLSTKEGKEFADKLVVFDLENEVMIGDDLGNVIVNLSTGEPMRFADRESADEAIESLVKEVGKELIGQFDVIERKFMVPHWTRMTWGMLIDSGVSPYNTRQYPFVPYISRQYTDDPKSIQGIVKNAIQPAEIYNKLTSQNLAIINTQTHTGWLNKKVGGADSKILSLLGSQPGVVIEWGSAMPQRIEPASFSTGHIQGAQEALANLHRVTGITDEKSGLTTQKTVSGSAIRERKEGSNTTLSPRFDNAAWAELNAAKLYLSHIQQFWPVEKIIRVVGIAELQEPLGRDGTKIFNGMTPSEVQTMVKDIKNLDFDLTFDAERPTASEQQAQFEKSVEAVSLATNAGYPVGQKTIMELAKMSGMPSTMKEAFLADLAQGPVAPQSQEQLAGALEETKNQFKGGRAGGQDVA